MAHINLLPWRAALNKERKRQFAVIAAGSGMLSVLVLVYIHIHMNGLITTQEARNKFLDGKIEEVEKQIKEIQTLETDKQHLLARMKIIQTLQGSRPEIVHLFQEITQTMPEGVYLTQVNVSGHTDTEYNSAGQIATIKMFKTVAKEQMLPPAPQFP